MESVPVVIWCGGKGTRLREETEYKPKPMVEIGGKPILWHIMKIYSHYGFRDFVLALGYKGNLIRDYFANYDLMNSNVTLRLGSKERVIPRDGHDERDWQVTLVDTGQEAMTGARLKRVQKYVGSGTFMATYGDAVTSQDIRALVDFHRKQQKQGKIATVTGIRPASRFGELQTDGDSVTAFIEKPKLKAWVSGGFFVFEQEVFGYVEDSDGCVFEKKPVENLARDGKLAIYKHEGFWHSMDTYKDALDLNELWANRPPWRVWR
jgi:glucose-1-phosphate cytidylyltransferase